MSRTWKAPRGAAELRAHQDKRRALRLARRKISRAAKRENGR